MVSSLLLLCEFSLLREMKIICYYNVLIFHIAGFFKLSSLLFMVFSSAPHINTEFIGIVVFFSFYLWIKWEWWTSLSVSHYFLHVLFFKCYYSILYYCDRSPMVKVNNFNDQFILMMLVFLLEISQTNTSHNVSLYQTDTFLQSFHLNFISECWHHPESPLCNVGFLAFPHCTTYKKMYLYAIYLPILLFC